MGPVAEEAEERMWVACVASSKVSLPLGEPVTAPQVIP